jgi:hypothetical protein
LQLANVNVGILYIVALASLGVYGIVLSGWSSNNKYSLLGGLRSSAQMISYELSLGLSIIGVLMVAGTLQMDKIVQAQYGWQWNIFLQPIGYVTFLVASGTCRRLPHGVQRHQVWPFLSRRVCEHHRRQCSDNDSLSGGVAVSVSPDVWTLWHIGQHYSDPDVHVQSCPCALLLHLGPMDDSSLSV